MRAYPLLHPLPGRHALDESGNDVAGPASIDLAMSAFAVKKLRIVGLAVLLLNFREVRSLHFCSTGVTM
jgi:hypothetical protein